MSRSLLLSDFGDSGQENQAATCAFPWSSGFHISAIPLGDAIMVNIAFRGVMDTA